MTYAVMPYSIDLAQLRRSLSGGQAATDRVLEQVDDAADWLIDDLGEDFEAEIAAGCPTPLAAIKGILSGHTDPQFGFMYGYGFKILCETFGAPLDGDAWSAIAGDHLEAVTAALEPHGLSEALSQLLYRGPPLQLPRADDFPSIGYLTSQEIKALLRDVRAEGLEGLSGAVGQSARELYGWLELCARNGTDLVGFYH